MISQEFFDKMLLIAIVENRTELARSLIDQGTELKDLVSSKQQ
jgi:hypothetical protein